MRCIFFYFFFKKTKKNIPFSILVSYFDGKMALPAFLVEVALGKMQDVPMCAGKKGAGKKENKFCVGNVKIIHSVFFDFPNLIFIYDLVALHITEKGFARCGLLQPEFQEVTER